MEPVTMAISILTLGLDAKAHFDERRRTDAETSPTALGRVWDFWTALRNDELAPGDRVTVEGTLAGYGPMTFGHPREVKANHFALRERLDDAEAAPTGAIDGLVSLSSGNPLIRVPPENGVKYAGLYEGIGRNAVPVFVNDEVYADWRSRESDTVRDVALTGVVRRIPAEWRDLMDVFGLDETYGYAVHVDYEDGIEDRGETRFFEADIWAAFQTDERVHWVSRCPDFTRPHELRTDVKALVDAGDRLPAGTTLVAQYDRVDRPVSGYGQVASTADFVQDLSNQAVRERYVAEIRDLLGHGN